MTTVEMAAAMRRPYLRLSDAMVESLKGRDVSDGDFVVRAQKVAAGEVGGIRFQRCGGGRRVIRRSGRY